MSELPAGYIELLYIRGIGAQYIDLDYIPDQDTRFVAKARVEKYTTSQLLGARTASASNAFNVLASSDAGGRDDWNAEATSFTITANELWEIDKNKNVTTINGVSVNHSVATFSCSVSMYLFAVNNNGALMDTTCASASFYMAKVYSGDDLKRDMIPCIDPWGNIGMYDLVDKKFHGNAGSGEFLPGPRKVSLPDQYAQLEYIESDGATYVDLGFAPDYKTRMICDYKFQDTTEEQTIAMARKSASAQIFGVFHNTSGWNYGYGSNKTQGATANTITDHILLDANKRTAIINGTALATLAESTFTAPVNLMLFARNTNGTINNYAKARCWFCECYDNGICIRQLIPAMDLFLGICGFYDMITGDFYMGNQVSGLTGGPEVALEEPSGGGKSVFVNIDGIWQPISGVSVTSILDQSILM